MAVSCWMLAFIHIDKATHHLIFVVVASLSIFHSHKRELEENGGQLNGLKLQSLTQIIASSQVSSERRTTNDERQATSL